MSGLSEKEQDFVREFLALMTEDAIRSLASTVTRRMVKADTIPACVDAVILHTTSLDEFLKRQKVTKENLFRFLNERKVSVPNTDKAALEQQIKDYVSSGRGRKHLIPSQHVASHSIVKPDLLSNTPAWVGQDLSRNQQHRNEQPNQQEWSQNSSQHLPTGAAQLYLAATSATASRVTVEQRVTTITASSASASALTINLPDTQETAVTNEFAKWFYPRLNQPPGVLAEDFWPDADLRLTLRGRDSETRRTGHGGSDVAQILNASLEEHQLYLHPNLSADGVWGRGNANGLLLVLVCGTLHHRTANHCLGVFENLFLLAQDPFAADNWKIRTLEAIFRSKTNVSAPLTFHDSELARTLQ